MAGVEISEKVAVVGDGNEVEGTPNEGWGVGRL